MQSSSSSDQRPSKPPQLTILVALVLIEALALLVIAGMYAVELATGQAHVSPGGAVFTMVLLIVLGAGIGAAGILLWRGYRWTRSVVLVVQLFAGTIGLPTMSGGYVLYGLLILVPAAAALYLLFSRPVFAITQRPIHENDGE
ncbi:hypothetical protein [Sinomonas humi]|uniref:Uncharacterized protein n=1 Tax=Sinomonas humi TaxID=1338436 RepID=A0A0B2AFR0_9MICC|nr:hypothetical protein [Sinomonas humi]KHL00650.1 hypothetical protein LK10_19160 [Sinomonas humi]